MQQLGQHGDVHGDAVGTLSAVAGVLVLQTEEEG